MEPTLAIEELTDLKVIDLLLLDDDELLREAKTFVVEHMFCEGLIGEFPTVDATELARIISMLGFLREKTSRYAGKHLAALLQPHWGDRGGDFCTWLDYCNKRDDIRASIETARNALKLGSILVDLAHIGGMLKEFIFTLKAPFVLPASVALFSLLYALDDLCGCDAPITTPEGKFDGKKGQSFDL